MTTTAPAPVIDAPSTEWRQLGPLLWVARRDGRHVGTVERGRRFVLTDITGEAVGAFRTLAEAVAGAEPTARATARPEPAERRSWRAVAVVATSMVGGGVAMGATALAVLAAR